MGTQTFSFTGNYQTFVVPNDVTSLDIECWGAQGRSNAPSPPYGTGGLGGYIAATVTVTPGETLRIYVGQQPTSAFLGGWPNGGNGGSGTNKGRGGGGSSDVRRAPFALADRLVIAGGGGGASYQSEGGGGAYPNGLASELPLFGSTAPTGGTQTAGGIGGDSTGTSDDGDNGSLGLGGTGANLSDGYATSGGGGGGGYYGGGGGALYGGGAGGSSAVLSGTLNTSTDSARSGNGQVVLTWGEIFTVAGSQAQEAVTAVSNAVIGGSYATETASSPSASNVDSAIFGSMAIEAAEPFTSIQVYGATAIESTSGNAGLVPGVVPPLVSAVDPYKFNVLDVDSQMFASSLGEWRLLSSNASLRRSAENARIISSLVEDLAYGGRTPYALEIAPLADTTATLQTACGWPGTFSVTPQRDYWFDLHTRVAAAFDRVVTVTLYFYDVLGNSPILISSQDLEITHGSPYWKRSRFRITTPSGAKHVTLTVTYQPSASINTPVGLDVEGDEEFVLQDEDPLLLNVITDAAIVAEGEALYLYRVTLVDAELFEENIFASLASNWIPDFILNADLQDSVNPDPLRRFFHAATWTANEILTLLRRFYYLPVVDGGDPDDVSDLFDPVGADDEWLRWIAQLVGLRPLDEINIGFSSWGDLETGAPTWADWENDYVTWLGIHSAFPAQVDALDLLRTQIANCVTGCGSGSTRALKEAVRLGLAVPAAGEDPSTVEIVRNHEGSMWKILIRTHLDQSLLTSGELVLLANAVKPVGVQVFHEFIEA